MCKKKIIMITGATGYIGTHLINDLLENTDCYIFAFARDKSKLLSAYEGYDRVICFDNNDINYKKDLWKSIDCVVHLAFARTLKPESEIADSLQFAFEIFRFVKIYNISAVINISSQNVYSNSICGIKNESNIVCPDNVYAMGKYATEIILNSVLFDADNIKKCNLRIDSIAGNKKLLPTFVKDAIENKMINIVGGTQMFSLNDVRDIVQGIRLLINKDKNEWKEVYNLGNNSKIYNIILLANIVKNKLENRLGIEVKINIEKKNINFYAGIDSTLFMQDTGWNPQYDIYDIVDKVIDEYIDSKYLGEKQ